MKSITRFITKKLKLKVNEAKSAVARPQERKFLGFSFRGGPQVKHIIAPTIQDVIAAEGPRLPAVDQSQRQFNTGMVIVVQHGAKPSRKLVERTEGIRKQWIDYCSITTGHRAVTALPH
jgi:hypothetical protein